MRPKCLAALMHKGPLQPETTLGAGKQVVWQKGESPGLDFCDPSSNPSSATGCVRAGKSLCRGSIPSFFKWGNHKNNNMPQEARHKGATWGNG